MSEADEVVAGVGHDQDRQVARLPVPDVDRGVLADRFPAD
jgi:hypothetical protein